MNCRPHVLRWLRRSLIAAGCYASAILLSPRSHAQMVAPGQFAPGAVATPNGVTEVYTITVPARRPQLPAPAVSSAAVPFNTRPATNSPPALWQSPALLPAAMPHVARRPALTGVAPAPLNRMVPTATIPTVVGPAQIVPVHHSTEMAIDEGMYPRTGAAAMCPDSRDPACRGNCVGTQPGTGVPMQACNYCGSRHANRCAGNCGPGNCGLGNCGAGNRAAGSCGAMQLDPCGGRNYANCATGNCAPGNCVAGNCVTGDCAGGGIVEMQPGGNPSNYPGNGAGTYPPYEAGAYPGNNFDFEQSMHSRGSFGTGANASSCAAGCGPGSVWNAAVAASACGCLWDECYDGWSVVGRWLVLSDFLMLKRNQSHSVPFATLNNNERVVLGTRVQDFPFRPAMRLGVGVPLSPKLRLEGWYFGMANWTETAAVRDVTPNALGGTGNLFSRLSNFGIPPSAALDYNSLASFAYYSALDNAELNLRHRLPTPPYVEASLLVGARYISVRERLSFGTQSSVPTSNLVETRTQNDMVGLQIGAALNAPVHWGWWFQGEIKGVLMQNSAAQQTEYTHTDSTSATTFLGSKSNKVASYAGDLSLWLSYQCSQRFVVRFGYQAFWFDGLALASQNVERNINILTLGPAQLLHGGRVVYHGPSIGATFSW